MYRVRRLRAEDFEERAEGRPVFTKRNVSFQSRNVYNADVSCREAPGQGRLRPSHRDIMRVAGQAGRQIKHIFLRVPRRT